MPWAASYDPLPRFQVTAMRCFHSDKYRIAELRLGRRHGACCPPVRARHPADSANALDGSGSGNALGPELGSVNFKCKPRRGGPHEAPMPDSSPDRSNETRRTRPTADIGVGAFLSLEVARVSRYRARQRRCRSTMRRSPDQSNQRRKVTSWPCCAPGPWAGSPRPSGPAATTGARSSTTLPRNDSRVWHDVRVCGNAMNLRAYRARQRAR
jgi:hypothetical protein